MATLIQSKQIQGVVTASVISGDFQVDSGSVNLSGASGVTGSFSGSFVGDGTGLTINYSQLQGKPTIVGGIGISVNQVGNTITITNTGGSGDGGGLSSAALNSISDLNAYTASTDIIISGLNQTTASLQSQINALVSATSSYITTDNTGSDNQTLSIVGDQLTIEGGNTITIPTGSGGGTSDFTQLTNVPSGLVSSSTQITDGSGIVSGSVLRTLDGTDVVSGSVLRSLDGTNVLSASVSFDQFSASLATDFQNIQHTQIPQGTISSSQQIVDLGFVTSSSELTLPSGLISSSQQLVDLGFSTTDLTGSDSQTLSVNGDQLTISGGNTITIPTGSNVTLPSGLISSSQQITDLGFIDSAHTDVSQLNQFTQSIQSQVDSLTNATSSYLTELPSGLVSGSVLRTLDGTGVVSGSVLRTLDGTGVLSGSIVTDLSSSLDSRISVLESQTDNTGSDTQTLSIDGNQITISDGNTITIPTGSNLPNGLITSSQQISDLGYVTSSLEAPFNGDRVVSNTLLGELYSQSFNAGTTSSLADFIEQVFFPTTAPTATFTNQTAKFNTNLATNNTNLVSVSLTDTVDNSPYSLVLSGTNASSLSAVPTNAESSSWEIRANGDLSAGTYSYDVTVGDSTNAERTYSGRSIVIAQADNGTLSTNGTLYIIESATSGVITLSPSGIPGSTGAVSVSYSPNYGSQVATNFSSSNPLIAVNSTNGQLSVGSPISGSGNVSGDTITSTISYEDQYGNQGSGNISVNVTQNNAPIVSNTQISNNNTNQARNTNQILQLLITDSEGDSIPNSGLSFSGYNTTYFTPTIATPYMRLNVNNTNVPAGTYPYTASLTDEHGLRTREVNGTITINSVDDGTLTGDSSIYIIESAVIGDSFRDATGYNNGNLANISVSYSPNYGSQVATLSSSNPAIVVDGSGNLTLGVDLSGSVTQSGDTFSSTISWTDQYGNSDSGTVTATVFGNQAPAASFTDNGLSDVTAVSGSNIGSLSITDTESNSPFQVTIGGTDGSKFGLVPQNAASSSWEVQPNQSLTIGNYSVQFTITDSYGEQATLNETISVSSDSDYGKVYVYTSTRVAGGALDPSNYLAVMGAETVDSSTPPLVSTYSADTASPFKKIKEGSLGQSTISVSGGQLDLRQEVSGSNLNTIISSSFSEVSTARQILVIFPSGSDMIGTPTSMTDSLGGSTDGEYVMFVKGAGDTSFGSETSTIHGVELDSPHEGYSTWYVIGRTGTNADSGFEVQIIPSSGSAPA